MTRFTNVSCGLDLSSGDVLVVGESLSAASSAALNSAIRIARDDGARLHLLTGLDLDAAGEFMIERERKFGHRTVVEHAHARLEALAAPARDAGVVVTTSVSVAAPAVALLHDAAREERDLIVVGTRERGVVARNLLGSTALTLLRRAPVAVWIARDGFGTKPPVVLAAVDLGDMAERIVAAAGGLASRTKGALHVLHVVDFAAEDVLRIGAGDLEWVQEYRRMKRQRAELEVPALVDQALGSGHGVRIHLPDGQVAETLLRAAEQVRADVVVVGSVVHSAAGAAISGLGRTAEAVLPALHTSLLVLKPAPAAGA